MNHPRLTADQVRDFVNSAVKPGVSPDVVTGFLKRVFADAGLPGPTKEEDLLAELVSQMTTLAAGKVDDRLEEIEAMFSGKVHAVLDNCDDAKLGDVGYWNYLAVRFFWPFIRARQHSAWSAAEKNENQKKDSSKDDNQEEDSSKDDALLRYLIGKDHYQLPLRMYLRGQAIKDGDDYSLAEVPGTDFWRSQILAVRTSHYPALARVVVRLQKERELSVLKQRPPGRRVNRLRSNIEFVQRTDEENANLVSEIWVDAESAEKGSATE